MDFYNRLIKELFINLANNYGPENYDENRFGAYNPPYSDGKSKGFVKKQVKKMLRKINYSNRLLLENQLLYPLQSSRDVYVRYYDGKLHFFEYLYNILNSIESKELLIKIVAYRLLGYTKVKLPTNNDYYQDNLLRSGKYLVDDEKIDVGTKFGYNFFILRHFKLDALNYPIEVFTTTGGLMGQFVLKQYEFVSGDEHIRIKVEQGDYVIDAGGCYGDTALFFAHNAGVEGKVFCFEFVPGNLKILSKNLLLNKSLAERIMIVENPLWNQSGLPLYFYDSGPGSRVSFDPLPVTTGQVNTISIDDFILHNQVPKVDFIKMDIEGAELNALKGAVDCIMKHKPKLAISIYHSPEEFGTIAEFINNLGLGYKFYLGHYTINSNETVIYAVI